MIEFERFAYGQMVLAGKKQHIFYKNGALFSTDSDGSNRRKLVKIPCRGLLRIFQRSALLERIFRLSPRGAAWLDETRFILGYKGSVYCVDTEKKLIQQEHCFPNGMSAPLSFCQIQSVPGFSDGIYYGTYIGKASTPICVVRRMPDGIWCEVYRFPLDAVLHIHNIIPDPAGERVLILTGDQDGQSGIWEARDDFSSVKPLLLGSQQYRSCVAMVCDGHIYYTTDTPLEQNWLYDYAEESGEGKKICPLPGPVIYGQSFRISGKPYLIFSTSVEPDSRKKGIWYLFTYRLGGGVQSRSTHLYLFSPENGLQELTRFRKDLWPMTLFQFGTVHPHPCGEHIFLSPQSVEKYNRQTLKLTHILGDIVS